MTVLEWLLSPCDPGRVHSVGSLLSWHARSMVLAWAVLIPVGIVAARFFKVFPGQDWPRVVDDRRWWRTHRATQYLSLPVMAVGLALILAMRDTPASVTSSVRLHHLLGWVTLGLGGLQYLGGWLRGSEGGPHAPRKDGSLRGDHYDMTFRRVVFERVHKSSGYVALATSLAAIATGLWQANAPNWMLLTLTAWYGLLAVASAVLQGRGMARDTYEAIWGDGAHHPGNARHPIGIGVTRKGSPPRER